MRHLRGPEDCLLRILHEDSELLVLNKPAGLVCHPTKGSPYSSLIGRLRVHVGAGGRTAVVHLVNRLDRETSGVILAAKTAEAAGELGRLWEKGEMEKEYLALVHGCLAQPSGVIDAPLGRDVASPVAIKDCVRSDGAPAMTRYVLKRSMLRDGEPYSLLAIQPLTGRKHQIRIHLAHLGHPVVGDKIYGGDERLYLDFVAGRLSCEQEKRLVFPFHALHADKLAFRWRDRWFEFHAQPEPWFTAFLCASS